MLGGIPEVRFDGRRHRRDDRSKTNSASRSTTTNCRRMSSRPSVHSPTYVERKLESVMASSIAGPFPGGAPGPIVRPASRAGAGDTLRSRRAAVRRRNEQVPAHGHAAGHAVGADRNRYRAARSLWHGRQRGRLRRRRLGLWQDDLARTARWCEGAVGPVTGLLGIRLGCALACEDEVLAAMPALSRTVFWQPVLDGSRHLAQFMRLRVAAVDGQRRQGIRCRPACRAGWSTAKSRSRGIGLRAALVARTRRGQGAARAPGGARCGGLVRTRA